MTLAQKIQQNRKARGVTQEELATALDVSHQSISKWESGQTMPGLDKVLLLSEYFGVSTDYLLKDDCENNAAPAPLPPVSLPQAYVGARAPKYGVYLGRALTVAGGAGIALLWVHSLLNPPYALGKTMGHLEKFSFYIRYHEMEARLTAAAAAMLLGAGILLLCRLRRTVRERQGAATRKAL